MYYSHSIFKVDFNTFFFFALAKLITINSLCFLSSGILAVIQRLSYTIELGLLWLMSFFPFEPEVWTEEGLSVQDCAFKNLYN